jgi:hypothetical protein
MRWQNQNQQDFFAAGTGFSRLSRFEIRNTSGWGVKGDASKAFAAPGVDREALASPNFLLEESITH